LGSYAAQRNLQVGFKKGAFFLRDTAIHEFNTPFHRFNDIPDPILDLWDRQIKWLDCPSELIAGIEMVRPFAALRDSNPVLRSVQIGSMFVVGANNFSLCRYKLPSSVPFAFNLPSYSSKPLLEFKGERQLRIARHHISNTAGDGVLFDFGNLRVCSRMVDGQQLIDKVNEYFNNYDNLTELIQVPLKVNKMLRRAIKATKKYETPILRIRTRENKISLSVCGNIEITEEFACERAFPPMDFGVDLYDFAKIVKKATMFGFNAPHDPLFLTDGKCQFLQQVFRLSD